MCGRYVSATPPDQLAKHFGATVTAERLLDPEFNVAPSRGVWTVYDDGSTRRLDIARWGLVPFWAKADPAASRPARIPLKICFFITRSFNLTLVFDLKRNVGISP